MLLQPDESACLTLYGRHKRHCRTFDPRDTALFPGTPQFFGRRTSSTWHEISPVASVGTTPVSIRLFEFSKKATCTLMSPLQAAFRFFLSATLSFPAYTEQTCHTALLGFHPSWDFVGEAYEEVILRLVCSYLNLTITTTPPSRSHIIGLFHPTYT